MDEDSTDEDLAKFLGEPYPNLNEDEHNPAINQEPLAATDDYSKFMEEIDVLSETLKNDNISELLDFVDSQHPFLAGAGNPTANQYPIEQLLAQNPTDNVGPSIDNQNLSEKLKVIQDFLMDDKVPELLGSTDGQPPFVPGIGNPTANQYFWFALLNINQEYFVSEPISAQNPTYIVGLSINDQNLCEELSASSSQMPSYINADKNAPHKFSFKVTPVGRLLEGLKALQALCDRKLNPKSKTLIEVDGYGFKITVHNESTEVMGRLHLEARFLSEFRYRSPFQKLTQGGLDEILDLLGQDIGKFGYENTITIFHMAGCSRALCYKFDGANVNKCVELARLVGEQYKKWPVEIKYSCEAELRADFFREIIPLLATSEGQSGSVKIDMIHMDFMEIMISIKNQEPRYTRKVKMAGVPYGQKHRSAFYFPHVESLMKASHLSDWCHVGFQNAPDRILLRFGLENLGALTYLNPSLTILNCLLD